MNLKFTWQPEEWNEALMLASAGPRRPPKPMMTYAVIAIMATGALSELVKAVRSSSQADYSGSLMPMLLFAAAVVIAMQVYTRGASRTRKLRPLAPMPTGEQHLVLSEGGWRIAAAEVEVPVRPWDDLHEQRTGRRSLILVGRGNALAALPLRVLNTTQGNHLHRLLMRKLHRAM